MRRIAVVCVALLGFALPAWSQDEDAAAPEKKKRELKLFGTLAGLWEDNQTSDLLDQGGEYDKGKALLTLNLSWWKLGAGFQLEYLYWSDQELAVSGDLDRLRSGFEFRKYWIDYNDDHVAARLGTFFTSFGRGLTLYVQKNDVVGLDEPIHGGNVTVDVGRFEFQALGGQVTDPLLEDTFDREFSDTIWGGRASVNLPADTYLGGSYVDATLDAVLPGQDDDTVQVWSAEAGGFDLAGVLDVHAEVAELDKVERSRQKDGYGRYLSVNANIGPVTILGEYIDYWNFDYRYNNPPAAGPADEAYDLDDVKGPRLLVSGNIYSTGTLITGSYGTFDTHRDETSTGGTNGDERNEYFLEVQETAGPVYLEAYYFNRRWLQREITEDHVRADLHVTTLGGKGDVAIGYDLRKEATNFFAQSFHRSYMSFSLSPWGTVGVRYSWNDKTNIPKEDFWGVDLQYLPSRAVNLGLFLGSDPGGLVCAGGQCRVEPPFKGGRATVNWRF